MGPQELVTEAVDQEETDPVGGGELEGILRAGHRDVASTSPAAAFFAWSTFLADSGAAQALGAFLAGVGALLAGGRAFLEGWDVLLAAGDACLGGGDVVPEGGKGCLAIGDVLLGEDAEGGEQRAWQVGE
ncbi:hypothetical protein GCM10010404_72630 [Nonomuraea africana]